MGVLEGAAILPQGRLIRANNRLPSHFYGVRRYVRQRGQILAGSARKAVSRRGHPRQCGQGDAGPKGRNVVMEKSFGAPRITKDGVTVAKEIELADKFENMGAQMVREVASKQSDAAGDGTTTATVLAHAIITEGAKSVAAGANPMDLKRGVDLAVDAIRRRSRKAQPQGHQIRRDRPGRHDFRQWRQIGRQDDRRGDGEGRQRGRHHRRRGQEPGDRTRRRRGHAVRPRLPLALFHHQRREDDRRTRRPLYPHSREEALRACRRCCRSSKRWCRPASRCSSSPRTSRARRWRRSSSTSCAAASRSRPSRRPASAIAARRCSRTSRSSPAAR